MKFNCAHCGKEAGKPTGHVNRARNRGDRLFCSRECSGLGRRHGKTKEQLKAEKRAYDMEYRARNLQILKAKKADHYQRTKDPVKQAEVRKARMPSHVEYCRRPEYRVWKKTYDRQYRAQKHYGDFAECFVLTLQIRDECLSRMSDYEIRQEKGTLNKALKRKRDDHRAYSNSPENGPLGNLERGERGQNGRLASGCGRLPSPRNPAHDEHAIAGGAAGEAAGLG